MPPLAPPHRGMWQGSSAVHSAAELPGTRHSVGPAFRPDRVRSFPCSPGIAARCGTYRIGKLCGTQLDTGPGGACPRAAAKVSVGRYLHGSGTLLLLWPEGI